MVNVDMVWLTRFQYPKQGMLQSRPIWRVSAALEEWLSGLRQNKDDGEQVPGLLGREEIQEASATLELEDWPRNTFEGVVAGIRSSPAVEIPFR
jgi:hypothetical protein